MCQVSSTIYNAALYSGMSIISVRNHSIPSPYIEKGRDATVSGGIIDLKFKNNSEYKNIQIKNIDSIFVKKYDFVPTSSLILHILKNSYHKD